MPLFNYIFLKNTIASWLFAVIISILVSFLLGWIKEILLDKLSKDGETRSGGARQFVVSLLNRTGKLFIIAVALYAGSLTLFLSANIHTFLKTCLIVIVLFQLAFWSSSLIDYLINRRLEAENEEPAAQATSLNALRLVAKIALWTIIILLILENLTGIEVNSLIASLGVTGVAVALAVQNILSDLFASLSIALDKPFVIGDSIIVGEFSGTVERIGLKSTRIRSLNGEEVVFSNSDLLNSRIRNLRTMKRRRVSFIISISHETPDEKLEKIPQIVQEVFQTLEHVSLDRVHLKDIGSSSLDYEIVFFVDTADFYLYMDLRQSINLKLLRQLKQEGINLARPVQVLSESSQSGISNPIESKP